MIKRAKGGFTNLVPHSEATISEVGVRYGSVCWQIGEVRNRVCVLQRALVLLMNARPLLGFENMSAFRTLEAPWVYCYLRVFGSNVCSYFREFISGRIPPRSTMVTIAAFEGLGKRNWDDDLIIVSYDYVEVSRNACHFGPQSLIAL